jgi:two-component system OmpR family response regulator
MHSILIVDDNIELRALIARILGEACAATLAGSIQEAKAHLEKSQFELIILDVGLPDGDGFKLCSFLQQDERHVHTPVIFLTGRGEIDDKLLAFSIGADDYIQKPFDNRELKARVLSKIGKNKTKQNTDRSFRRGDLRFCLDTQRVFVVDSANNEQRAELTAIEFKLLLYFANHVDHVLSRNQVMDAVWGSDVHISDRTVDSHISKLRGKLTQSLCQIVSIQGEGYRFSPANPSKSLT